MFRSFIWLVTVTTTFQQVPPNSDFRPYFLRLWPQPRFTQVKYETVHVHPKRYRLHLEDTPMTVRPLMTEMTRLAFKNVWNECGQSIIKTAETNVILKVSVLMTDLTVTWESSERYTLTITTMNNTKVRKLQVYIAAHTVIGFRHALETFTQLASTVKSMKNNQCTVNFPTEAKIRDEPAYSHRGLFLDTATRFFRPSTIKRMLDGMAASKLNVFHWHVMDLRNFPSMSVSAMLGLSRYGAFKPLQKYTKEDIKDIIEYAQNRGIVVMFEIDGPGRMFAGWSWKMDKRGTLMMRCPNVSDYRQFTRTIRSSINVLNDLYEDILKYLPKQTLFHVGGAEISKECWDHSDGNINPVNDTNGYLQLWSRFYNMSYRIWDELYSAVSGRKHKLVMLWSSELTDPKHIDQYLDPKRFVIELSNENDAPELTRLGYRVVVVSSRSWNLNDKDLTWQQVYSHKLTRNPKKILGGEIIMWTVNVTEIQAGQYYLDSCIWPRAAAFAERLWTDPLSREPNDHTIIRLKRHHQRLLSRGLNPAGLEQNMWPNP